MRSSTTRFFERRRCTSRRSRGEVHLDRGTPRRILGVAGLCRLLEVSRTGYLQWRRRPSSRQALANRTLDARVAAIHAASKRSYGRPRIVQDLRNQGIAVGHERVRRSLQRQGLRPVYKRPYRVTTDSGHQKTVSPNLLDRRFDCWQINQAWVCDITYVGTAQGWLYLATVMDLASRRIVGWSMNERMKADLVCDALKSAYWRRKRKRRPSTALVSKRPVVKDVSAPTLRTQHGIERTISG